ncbi:MAG TPA: hypothetical protein VLG44_07250 [Chlamydiales bacterium]|nr:hypothetical protein [Chlamydiales bacterium]
MIKRLAIVFLFASCSSVKSDWSYQKMPASRSEFASKKLTCKGKNKFHGLEFELLHYQDKTKGYINIFSQKVPSHEGLASIALQIEEMAYEELVPLLKGEQKLLLSDKIIDLIVTALKEGKKVKVSLEGYEDVLEPQDFITHIKKLEE